jgi:hypothetical protein
MNSASAALIPARIQTLLQSLVACTAIATGAAMPAARAAEPVDMEELTCRDLTRTYFEEFAIIDAWLSGYFHGRMNKTVVDRKEVATNAAKVVAFCKSNPDITVIKAVEQLIAKQ